MIPVYQKVFDKGRGDCFNAALASILDLKYEDVPAFITEAADFGQPHRWDKALRVWLYALGFRLHIVAWKDFRDWRGLKGAFALLSVPSQRFPGGSHAVVCTWIPEGNGSAMRIVHDPCPSNVPYPINVEPTFVKFLVPLSPARLFFSEDLERAKELARSVIRAPLNNEISQHVVTDSCGDS